MEFLDKKWGFAPVCSYNFSYVSIISQILYKVTQPFYFIPLPFSCGGTAAAAVVSSVCLCCESSRSIANRSTRILRLELRPGGFYIGSVK